jgi:hypothetical protein
MLKTKTTGSLAVGAFSLRATCTKSMSLKQAMQAFDMLLVSVLTQAKVGKLCHAGWAARILHGWLH